MNFAHAQRPIKSVLLGLIAVLVVGSASLVACSNGSGSGPRVGASLADDPTSPTTGSSLPGRVVATAGSEAYLKNNARTLAELVASPELALVARGKVADVSYERIEGVEQTRLVVSVSQTLFGPSRDQVIVREDGGFARATDIESENLDKFPGRKPTARPDDWIDLPFEGATHPKVGDEVILFLSESSYPPHKGEYQEVGSVYGRFALGADGRFLRAGADPDKRLAIDVASVQEALAVLSRVPAAR